MSKPLRTSRTPLDTFLKVSEFPPEFAGYLKYEFDKHLYYYGGHFSNGYDRVVPGRNPAQYQAELIEFYWKHQPAVAAGLAGPSSGSVTAPCIFSNAYFGWERPLSGLGLRLLPSPWVAAEPGNELSIALFNQCRAVLELLRSGFAVLYFKPFHAVIRSIAANLEKFFSRHPALGILMPYTNGFFEGLSTGIFRRLGKPTFLCVHGLPVRMDWWKRGEHPVDYVVVWGEATKRGIVERGRAPETVLVSGHPDYSGRPPRPISTALDRVLVLGYALNGAPLLDVPHFQDRSLGLDYLWRVQSVLKQVGVARACVRPHPSESVPWYRAHLDPDFYTVDESRSCAEALDKATMVIGPVSTVLADAAVAGVNYITFVPALQQYNPLEDEFFQPDIPYDGSDPRFPVARSEAELVALLKQGAVIDVSALTDYLSSSFKPEVIVEALKLPVRPGTTAAVAPTPVPSAPVPSPAKTAVTVAPLHIPEVTEVPAKAFELQVLETVRPFTMTPPQVTLNAMRAVAIAEERRIEGAIVECGVWRGGVSMAMMHQLKKCGGRRSVFLYDTFDGMSEPTEEDLSPSGEAASKLLAEHKKDEANHFWAFAPIDRVRRNIESVGYPMELVRMTQGKVEDTIPGVIPDRIAVLRLDTDWYESTRHELIHLYSRLVPGGIMILDDYGFWQGARKAVDEFFETLPQKPELHTVHDNLNSCVRWCVKP